MTTLKSTASNLAPLKRDISLAAADMSAIVEQLNIYCHILSNVLLCAITGTCVAQISLPSMLSLKSLYTAANPD